MVVRAVAGLGIVLAMNAVGCRGAVSVLLEPEVQFDPAAAPPALDYADAEAWAARPDAADGADRTPAGSTDAQASSPADVFFVQPTTLFSDEGWNQGPDDDRARRWIDEAVMPNQASVFNGAGRVFAPRYRQATLWTFMERERLDEVDGAMGLAYQDVARAFEHYLAREGGDRPFILAAHSQGSFHALRLLAERIDPDPALRERLVAAYLIGIAIPTDVFGRLLHHTPPCASAEETGCVVAWNTFTEDATVRRFMGRAPIYYDHGAEWLAGKEITCVNPITWTSEGNGEPERHLGGVRFEDADEAPVPDAHLVGARCEKGVLRVSEPAASGYDRGLGGDLHLVDYAMFYMNLRSNAADRVAAFVRD